jgi:hypothetical protein
MSNSEAQNDSNLETKCFHEEQEPQFTNKEWLEKSALTRSLELSSQGG